jgi:hypothetical protein
MFDKYTVCVVLMRKVMVIWRKKRECNIAEFGTRLYVTVSGVTLC